MLLRFRRRSSSVEPTAARSAASDLGIWRSSPFVAGLKTHPVTIPVRIVVPATAPRTTPCASCSGSSLRPFPDLPRGPLGGVLEHEVHRVHEADLALWDELGEALAGRPAARLLLRRLGRSEEERRHAARAEPRERLGRGSAQHAPDG